jgi:anti-sigma factor RsiW
MMSRHLGQAAWRWCEGALSPEARAQVEAHLAECAECRAEMQELREIAQALGALPAALEALPVYPRQAWATVQARLAARARLAGPHPAWRAALSLACVLVVFGLSNTFFAADAARAAALPIVSAPSAAATAIPQAALIETGLPAGGAFASARPPAYTLTPTPDPAMFEQ